MSESFRNPVFIPKKEPKGRECQQCGSGNWVGRNVQGIVLFTCKDCGFKWEGGLPQMPEDPMRPTPQTNYRPFTDYLPQRNKKGELVGYEELQRRPDATQAFRKGAPIPEDEENG